MPRHTLATAALAALLLTACATAPEFDTEGVDPGLGPQAAAERASIGARVLWGGVVLSGRNEADRTLLEVVGYPLGRNGRPDTAAPPIGRFIIEKPAYLELADYAPGRQVTVVGPVRRVETGTIGGADYRFPVVDAGQLHAWEPETARTSPAFHIGVGVVFSR